MAAKLLGEPLVTASRDGPFVRDGLFSSVPQRIFANIKADAKEDSEHYFAKV